MFNINFISASCASPRSVFKSQEGISYDSKKGCPCGFHHRNSLFVLFYAFKFNRLRIFVGVVTSVVITYFCTPTR